MRVRLEDEDPTPLRVSWICIRERFQGQLCFLEVLLARVHQNDKHGRTARFKNTPTRWS